MEARAAPMLIIILGVLIMEICVMNNKVSILLNCQSIRILFNHKKDILLFPNRHQ
jgi:hypothetical protein